LKFEFKDGHAFVLHMRNYHPEIALLLSKALDRSPESWPAMQYNHDLWQARQSVNLGNVSKVRLTAA